MALPIDYAPPPRRRVRLRPAAVLAVTIVLALWLVVRPPGPTSADIRLDTGDLRYRWFGVPVWYDRMPEPTRSHLLAAAAGSAVLTPEWQTCVTYPLPTSNNTDAMCRGFYAEGADWIPADPGVARLVLEDVATYVRRTNARSGLPASVRMLSPLGVMGIDARGIRTIRPDWRDDPEVQAYLQSKGYVPPATAPAR